MSKLLKSRNLFLEKEELVRWNKFIVDDGYKDFIKNSLKNGGLVSTVNGLGDNFRFIEGSSHFKIALTEDSLAYDSQGNRIKYIHSTGYEWTLSYTEDGTKDVWVYLQYGTTALEQGTLVLNSGGSLVGTGTEFTKLFRGTGTLVQNKIRIYKREVAIDSSTGYSYTLVGTYSVNQVNSDTSIDINTSATFSTGTYVFSVVGAFSPGTYSDVREEEIYQYDFVDIQFSDTDPTGTLTDDQYMLCKATIDDSLNTQTIVDLRYGNYSFSKSSILKLNVDSGWVNIADYVTGISAGAAFFEAVDDVWYKVCDDGTIQLRGSFPISYDDAGGTYEITGEITQVDGVFPKIDGRVLKQPLLMLGLTNNIIPATFVCDDQVNFTFSIDLGAGAYDTSFKFFTVLRGEYS